jgi:hypothetical protein
MFGWLQRLLTRLLSPEIIKGEILRSPAAGPAPAAAAPPPPPLPMPAHKDPKTDTAVIRLEGVRREARKVMDEARETCESARRPRASR